MSAHTTLKLNRPKRDLYRDLAELGELAAPRACPPLSDFHVGVAALLWDGRVYLGCNTENPGLDLTIHGEMSAVNGAIADGALADAVEDGLDQFSFVKAVAVTPNRCFEAWPCGHCRDFLSGYGQSMDIVVRQESGGVIWKPLARVLPFAPVARELISSTRNGSLLELISQPPKFQVGKRTFVAEAGVKMGQISDKRKAQSYETLLEYARNAASLSYSPYSKRPSGAAVLLHDGSVYTGCRVENVGYTVSSNPEQAAIYSAIADGALMRHIQAGGSPLDFVKAVASVPLGQPDTWPSGSTRQCLCDFGLKLDVVVESSNGSPTWKPLSALLPGAFVPDVLSYWTGN